ncbi:MAG: TonB-dependent receptor [Novosphingobium sp.]
MKKQTVYRSCAATSLLLLASTSSLAWAQEVPQAEAAQGESETAGEIVVTATKRQEKLQEVPISLSAISGDSVSKSRVTQMDDLVTKTPNLQLTSTAGENVPIFSLRGVSMSDYSLNQASPVATYFDEVYKGNPAFLGVAMFDLERVEVLRGPQGTLYGKNTTGGAVNLISKTAKLGETSGYLNFGYGNYSRIDANGAINLPLGEKAAIRLAGTISRADGWFKNQVPGKADLASVREYGLRGSILFEPSDGVRFVLRAATTFQNPRNYGVWAQPESVWRIGLKRDEIRAEVDQRRYARTFSVALTSTFDLNDTLAITSVTSWDKGKLHFREDSDGSDRQILTAPYFDRASQFAQDLRLTSDFDGPFNFILGAYFNREKVFNASAYEIGLDVDTDGQPGVTSADCALSGFDGCLFRNQFDQLKKSYALYSDVSFKVTDALTIRGGLRYTHDKGVQSDFTANVYGPDEILVSTIIPSTTLRYSTNNLSGKIGLDYKINRDVMIYASFSRGYRAPSFNAQAFFDPRELSVAKAEKINAYEMGVKSQFLDRRITLNAAVFQYDYTDQQFLNYDGSTGVQTLLNVSKSRIRGGEAELTARATDFLTLRASVGVLDAKVKSGELSGTDVAGNRLLNAPKLNFGGGVEITAMENESGKVSLHGDLSYASSQYFDIYNTPRLKQKAYALLSGHIDWESSDGKYFASIWGKNLTNKFYFTSRVDLLGAFGYDYNHIGTPRTYGGTVGIKF